MPHPIPPDKDCFIPHLCCSPCSEAIEFYKKAFGAEEVYCLLVPGGKRVMHAELRIDGKPFFLVDDFPEYCGGKASHPLALGGTPVTVHRFVADCDAAVQRAVDAGATLLMPVQDMFWGDRYGAVVDPFGHKWSLATQIKDVSPDEMQRGMEEAFRHAPPNPAGSEL